MQEPIKGKVARILDSRQLVLNIGESAGVTIGMIFRVLDPKGENITDPDTGKILGSLNRPKVKVKVIQVDTSFSVAQTFVKKRVNIGGYGIDVSQSLSPLSEFLNPPKWVETVQTLKTNEKTWEDLEESESFVKVGDPVIEVLEEEKISETKEKTLL